MQWKNWLAFWKDNELHEENPHTEAWMQHDLVVTEGAHPWTEECLAQKAARYRQMWLYVFRPAFESAERVVDQRDKQRVLSSLNSMLSDFEFKLQSRSG